MNTIDEGLLIFCDLIKAGLIVFFVTLVGAIILRMISKKYNLG